MLKMIRTKPKLQVVVHPQQSHNEFPMDGTWSCNGWRANVLLRQKAMMETMSFVIKTSTSTSNKMTTILGHFDHTCTTMKSPIWERFNHISFALVENIASWND
jgi:hypothetical protein